MLLSELISLVPHQPGPFGIPPELIYAFFIALGLFGLFCLGSIICCYLSYVGVRILETEARQKPHSKKLDVKFADWDRMQEESEFQSERADVTEAELADFEEIKKEL